MTIDEAKKALVVKAKSQVGYREGSNNWNKYAEDPKITKLYGWKPQNTYWCCTFVNWCYLDTFGFDVGSKLTYGGTAACQNSANLFKNNAAFASQPEVGDQIFFYVGGTIGHTGIVTEINGSSIKTVEGNYSDGVGIGTYLIGSSKIAGYGRPNWSLVTGIESPKQDTEIDKEDHRLVLPLLRMSNKFDTYCVMLQSILNARHFACGSTDGFYGPKTYAAVSKAQTYFKITVDGECGKETWKHLMEVEK